MANLKGSSRPASSSPADSLPNMDLLLTNNAFVVLARRYLKKDEQGQVVETSEEMFRRVARTIAQADLIYDENADVDALAETFYEVMISLRFLPNSPTLMNAGRELGQLSACFVLPIDDSIESIFEAIQGRNHRNLHDRLHDRMAREAALRKIDINFSYCVILQELVPYLDPGAGCQADDCK